MRTQTGVFWRVAIILSVTLVATSCAESEQTGTIVMSETSTTLPAVLEVKAEPPEGATNIAVDHGIKVTVTNAVIKSIAVTATDDEIRGDFNANGDSWISTAALAPKTTYQVAVTLTDAEGNDSDRSWSFSTGDPEKVFKARISPGDGVVVGVGMPIVVKLNTKVDPAKRAEIEQLLSVTSTPPQPGAWRWFSKDELHYRPPAYWQPNTQIKIRAGINRYSPDGVAYGVADVNVAYKIGDANISTVDAKTHQMTVTKNGQVVKTIPISTGKKGFETRSGIHVVSEKMAERMMDSATVGIPRDSPDGYYKKVLWDVRISNSGEFVHAAPWSVDSQGSSNVSHGCVNASTANAKWFYEFTQTGDVVIVTGTSRQLEEWNGLGDWQVPWEKWDN